MGNVVQMLSPHEQDWSWIRPQALRIGEAFALDEGQSSAFLQNVRQHFDAIHAELILPGREYSLPGNLNTDQMGAVIEIINAQIELVGVDVREIYKLRNAGILVSFMKLEAELARLR